MAHEYVPSEEDVLYGYRTDLKDALRNRELPAWLSVSEHRNKPSDLEGRIDEAAEDAREYRQAQKERHNENPRLSKDPSEMEITREVLLKIDRSRAPASIADKLPVSTERARRYTGRHHATRRQNYFLQVEVGVKGGIVDMQTLQDFHV
jgi:hypothetical protein